MAVKNITELGKFYCENAKDSKSLVFNYFSTDPILNHDGKRNSSNTY